jgi:predicted Zn finger-like uncharacterized protein
MNVTCPNCATIYRVDPAKVPEAGVRARCNVCSAVFAVRREMEQGRPVPAAPAPAPAAVAESSRPAVKEAPPKAPPEPPKAASPSPAAPTAPPPRPHLLFRLARQPRSPPPGLPLRLALLQRRCPRPSRGQLHQQRLRRLPDLPVPPPPRLAAQPTRSSLRIRRSRRAGWLEPSFPIWWYTIPANGKKVSGTGTSRSSSRTRSRRAGRNMPTRWGETLLNRRPTSARR